RVKHAWRESRGSVWLTPDKKWSRVAFTAGDKPDNIGGDYRADKAIELRPEKTVVQALSEAGHTDLAELIAKTSKLANLEAGGVIGQGNESVAVEVMPSKAYPDGGVLKISIPECGWETSWGRRPFDAKLLSGVHSLDMSESGTGYAYVQELVTTMDRYDPVLLDRFMEKIAESGKEFQDPGADPTKQIGISDTTGEIVLIDYGAVDKPGTNETHQTIIGGAQRVEAQYDAEDRLDFKEETDSPENVYETV